jgi:hypothetical protein
MKADQWFSLWMTLLSVMGGGVAALLAVWVGAALALRGNRRASQAERARLAAERCLSTVDAARHGYHGFRVMRDVGNEVSDLNHVKLLQEQYDRFANSEVGHEAWLLRDRSIAIMIANCLQEAVQLHLDSFFTAPPELLDRACALHDELRSVGDRLRAEVLGKPVSQLTDDDRRVAAMLLPGKHARDCGAGRRTESAEAQ